MILIYGTLHDEMIELMCSRFKSLSYQYILIDPSGKMKVSFTYRNIDGRITGLVSDGKLTADLNDVTGIYARFAFVRTRLGRLSTRGSEAIRNERNSVFIDFIDRFRGLVINRVGNSSGNDSKLYQQNIISGSGFFTPRTLITSLPSELSQFYDFCNGKIIYKSISGIRSVVTNYKAADIKKLTSIKNCPVQFQEFIEGTDIRVHTVGNEIFATAIESDSIDYRYAAGGLKPVKFYEYDLPAKISKACFDITGKMGFNVAGIDLKVTSEGKYYCFEVNPSPAFIFYERMTGQPVSLAVAELLNKGS